MFSAFGQKLFFLSKRPASANNSRQILLLAHCFLYDEANSCKESILNSCIDCGIVKLQPREYIVILPTCLFGIGTGAECNNKINLIKTFLGTLYFFLFFVFFLFSQVHAFYLSVCISIYSKTKPLSTSYCCNFRFRIHISHHSDTMR